MFIHIIRITSVALISISLHAVAMHNDHRDTARLANNVIINIQDRSTTSSQEGALWMNKHLRCGVGLLWGTSLFILSQVPESVCKVSQCSATSDTLAQIISIAGPAVSLFGAYTFATSYTKPQRIAHRTPSSQAADA